MCRLCGGILVWNKDNLTASTTTCGGKAPSVIAEKDVDYTVTYTAALGKATATVEATGSYAGTITENFIIKPAKVTGLKVTVGNKKATVSYTAQKGAKYQLVCKPTSGKAKTVTTSLTKKTVTGLRAGTYNVYVRAYAKIGGTTDYGSYATKSVRVK